MQRRSGALLGAALFCGGCGKADDAGTKPGSAPGSAPAAREESTTSARVEATPPGGDSALVTPDRTGAPRVLFLGTSLTAGLGLESPETESYPAVLQRMADSAGVRARIVNAGLSGETSAGALRRADWLLRERADVVVIETGANDGLRGLNADSTAANLRALIGKIRAASPKARILLVQMEAPTNLGAEYTRRFHAIFPATAASEKVVLLPFLLEGVAGIPRLNQPDGIHPTADGARRAARNVWSPLARAIVGRAGPE